MTDDDREPWELGQQWRVIKADNGVWTASLGIGYSSWRIDNCVVSAGVDGDCFSGEQNISLIARVTVVCNNQAIVTVTVQLTDPQTGESQTHRFQVNCRDC